MKLLAILILLSSCTPRTQPDLKEILEIKAMMQRVSPDLADQVAIPLARAIHSNSKKYKISAKVAVAIFKQESNFKLDAVNYVSKDFGLGQINYRSILERKINLGKLLTNQEYAVEQTFAILADLKSRYAKIDYKNGRKWWTRYHSRTPALGQAYNTRIEQHLSCMEKAQDERKKTR